MKKYFLVTFLAFSSLANAQTLLEDQFQFNFLALNPAFAGARETFSMNAMLGNQFNGTLRPQQIYQLFSTDGAIQQGRGGLGLQAFNSNSAGFSNSGVKISYAYRKQIGDLFSVALGADAGFIYQPTLLVGSGLKQMYPYAGLGGLLNAQRFFVSLSKPVAFINDEGLFNSKKPFYTMLGFSLGEYDGTMFNISTLIETNKATGNGFNLNGKAWFARKFGLGVSYRSQEISGARVNKLIPMAEFQVSDAIRLGASYDSKPPTFNQVGSSNNFQQRGILQIYLRYEGHGLERSTNRLKYY
ncbi:MAG: PorP/SprF family type IX secretion system membrane protein [Emticicia sp.]|nr:PorP/SprF family type IX secretion system membrane protein [Emticicia sp.]